MNCKRLELLLLTIEFFLHLKFKGCTCILKTRTRLSAYRNFTICGRRQTPGSNVLLREQRYKVIVYVGEAMHSQNTQPVVSGI